MSEGWFSPSITGSSAKSKGERPSRQATLTASWKGRPLDLTRREFALLRVLMEQRGRPMARDAIQRHLYGWDADVASNAVDVHVHQLRRKLEPGIIRTVRGLGYALGDAVGDAP